MKVEVTDRCTGHGRCYMLAPDVYSADDEGYNAAIGSVLEVADADAEAARMGVLNCPEGALVIVATPATAAAHE